MDGRLFLGHAAVRRLPLQRAGALQLAESSVDLAHHLAVREHRHAVINSSWLAGAVVRQLGSIDLASEAAGEVRLDEGADDSEADDRADEHKDTELRGEPNARLPGNAAARRC